MSSSSPFGSDSKFLVSVLAASGCVLLVVSAGCLQPSKSTSDFGAYTGNAVAPNEDDASAPDAPGRGGGAVGVSEGESGGGSTAMPPGGGSPAGGTSGAGTDPDPGTGGSERDAGVIDAGGSGGTPPDSGTGGGGASAPSSLTFSVLTKSLGGRFAPRNIGAIWVEDQNGKFVKTLERWARQRQQYLTNFNRASGGDLTDAVTSATLSSHRTHTVQWDLTDVSGKVVPDGSYRVRVECTEQNATGDTVTVPFTKGPSPVSSTPSNAAHFTNMSVRLQ